MLCSVKKMLCNKDSKVLAYDTPGKVLLAVGPFVDVVGGVKPCARILALLMCN